MAVAWYALRSKPNKEMAVWREVRARGVESPYTFLRVRPVNPRSRPVKPYFPGYMFVHVDPAQTSLSAFQWIPFCQGLVSFGGEPAGVPEALVMSIKARVDEINALGGETSDARETQAPRIRTGDKVMISDGPFAGYQAIFDRQLDGADRVRVLLSLLRARPMRLDLPAAQIQPTNRR